MTRKPWKVAAAVVAGMAVSWGLYLAPASGASQTGADRSGLARFQRQHLDWHACQQGPQDEDGQVLD